MLLGDVKLFQFTDDIDLIKAHNGREYEFICGNNFTKYDAAVICTQLSQIYESHTSACNLRDILFLYALLLIIHILP